WGGGSAGASRCGRAAANRAVCVAAAARRRAADCRRAGRPGRALFVRELRARAECPEASAWARSWLPWAWVEARRLRAEGASRVARLAALAPLASQVRRAPGGFGAGAGQGAGGRGGFGGRARGPAPAAPRRRARA